MSVTRFTEVTISSIVWPADARGVRAATDTHQEREIDMNTAGEMRALAARLGSLSRRADGPTDQGKMRQDLIAISSRVWVLASRVEAMEDLTRPETAREREGRVFSLRRWVQRAFRARQFDAAGAR
jgi:hypothetical protein